MSGEEKWGFEKVVFGLAFAAVVVLIYVMQWSDCSKSGGVFVQGGWWFMCVEPHPINGEKKR